MGNFNFNIALGRPVELYNRVQTGDPAGSALLVVMLAATGLEADLTLKRKASLAAVLAGTTNEPTNTGYVRKAIAGASLTASAPDNSNDWTILGAPDQVWASVQPGDSWSKVLYCYRPAAGSPDSAIVPITASDFFVSGVPVVPNGNNITAQVTNGWLKAV